MISTDPENRRPLLTLLIVYMSMAVKYIEKLKDKFLNTACFESMFRVRKVPDIIDKKS
jgi:hypothetical protein